MRHLQLLYSLPPALLQNRDHSFLLLYGNEDIQEAAPVPAEALFSWRPFRCRCSHRQIVPADPKVLTVFPPQGEEKVPGSAPL